MVLICCSAIDRHCFLQPGRQQGPATWSKPSPEVGHLWTIRKTHTATNTKAHRTPSNDTHMHLQHVSAHAFVCERTCTQVTSVTTSPRAQLSAYARTHTHTHAHAHAEFLVPERLAGWSPYNRVPLGQRCAGRVMNTLPKMTLACARVTRGTGVIYMLIVCLVVFGQN